MTDNIAVGYSRSNDQDMENLSKASNGYYDAVIVKYDKNLENVIWKKSFGGSDDDIFDSIVKINDNEIIVIGYSKSNNMDMLGLNELDGYKKSIIIKYSANNGSIIEKKVFGGNNSDYFTKIIKTRDDKYLVTGSTYSNDIDLMNFNKGHGDAMVVKYNKNLNLDKSLKEPVVLIDVLKKIEPNYGININLKYDNIYTSNDPTKDLLGWCSPRIPYLEENTSNYYYGACLKSFNEDDIKILVEKEITYGLKMYKGEYEYTITKQPNNKYNWHMLWTANQNSGSMEYSNLKLKFVDGYIGHITDAIDKGYIEPLVIVSSRIDERDTVLLPTIINIINETGSTGEARLPHMYIILKPKKSELSNIILTSSRDDFYFLDGLGIYELRNFDMSITPTN